ncbi:histidine kinase [Rhizobium ruizarguesonis]
MLRLILLEPDQLDRGLAMSAGRSTLAPIDSSKTGEVFISEQARDLLRALSYVHLEFGQGARHLALLRFAAHADSLQVDLLRVLAYALISEGRGDEAPTILDRPDILDEQPSWRLPLTLMCSHALRRAGRMEEARAVFQSYVSLRGSAVLIEES